jgi:hypothetical protein
MANKFTGIVRNQTGELVVSAKVILNENDKFIASGSTDNNGRFELNTPELDPKKCKLIITKEGKELRSIDNPQPTGEITTGNLQITAQEGGFLELKSQYRGGEYYFSSLGLGSKDNPDLVKDNFDLNLTELGGLISICSRKTIPLDLIITGSESKIPNTDNEQFLNDGKTANPNKDEKLPELELAKRRVQYLNEHITTDIFKDQNVKNQYNKIKQETFIISGPDFPAPSGQNPDYTQYQYVSIKALPTKPTCTQVSVAQKAGENKIIPYVAPGSKYCKFAANYIPDRFGFNGYYSPYYYIDPSSQRTFKNKVNDYVPKDDKGIEILSEKLPIIPEVNNSRFYPLDIWGFFIFLFLYIKNSNSTKFLDETRPGLKLDYKLLTPKEKDEILDKFKKALDINNDINLNRFTKSSYRKYVESISVLYNSIIHSSVKELIEKYPNAFPPFRSFDKDKNPINVPITPTTGQGGINNSITQIINSMDRVAIITLKAENPTFDITLPEYNLRTDPEQQRLNPNVANGISSVPLLDKSIWSYCICDDVAKMTDLRGNLLTKFD